MAHLVTFQGREQHLPNDSLPTPPLAGTWYVGEQPRHTYHPETGEPLIPAFTEVVVDKALAEQYGRSCNGTVCPGKDCDGACFAAALVAPYAVEDGDNPVFTVTAYQPPKPPKPTTSTDTGGTSPSGKD